MLTKVQKEILQALKELGRKKYFNIDEITDVRLRDPYYVYKHARSRIKQYLNITYKICEELTRKGYADQKDTKKEIKYKITIKGLKKAESLL